MPFAPSPTTEDLASFLQGLPAGAHVAVNLGSLDLATAMRISRQAADERGDRFVVIGHRTARDDPVADTLGKALPLDDLLEGEDSGMVVVDASTSVGVGGAVNHAIAERAVSLQPGPKLTVICLYTEDAFAQVTPDKVYDLHTMVSAPGQV